MKPILSVQNLSKAYGTRNLFDNASLTINSGEKIGVIGRNGAGKSTFFRIVIGQENQDFGDVIFSNEHKLSYLEQSDTFEENEPVIDFLMRKSDRPLWECARMAARFELDEQRIHAPITDLSGGYRMRVKLTAMMLDEPDFLMLDEPTNYLDLRTLLILENFLRSFSGGYMIISHDREFLKRTCLSTLEVENGSLVFYPDGVEDYLEFKEEQKEQIDRINKNISARQKELQSFIERFRAKASKASQAQSKLKQLGKMRKIEVAHNLKNVKINIPSVKTRRGLVFQCEGLSAGYEDTAILENIELKAAAGRHTAVLGDNGQGKTTLLRTLAGEIPPIKSQIHWTEGVRTGYFAQHVYENLAGNKTIRETLQAAGDAKPQEVLDLAGSFLFSGNDVDKKISILSGGEKARVVLASLLLGRYDVLLLDEPTNHLDFETVEALADALKRFNGTVFFVSHDRTFVNMAADSLYIVENGRVFDYPGTYEDYVFHLQDELERSGSSEKNDSKGKNKDKKNKAPSISETPNTEDSIGTNNKSLDSSEPKPYHKKKELKATLNRLKKEEKEARKKMDELTKELNELLESIQNGAIEVDQKTTEKLQSLQKGKEQAEEFWLEIEAQAESIINEIDTI